MYKIYNRKGFYVGFTDSIDEAVAYIVENGGSIEETQ